MVSKTFEQILLTRRQFSQGLMTLIGLSGSGCGKHSVVSNLAEKEQITTFNFPNLPPQLTSTHEVSEGYIVERLIELVQADAASATSYYTSGDRK